MSTIIKGKALLVIERQHEEEGDPHYEVFSFIQSCSGNEMHRDCAYENFQHLEYDVLPLPEAAYRLKPWERVRVAVTFEFYYRSCGDYGAEVDVDLEYAKQRVLRKQKPRKYYEPKGGRHAR